jgi:hypothetical protein
VQKCTATFDVAQKVETESLSVAGALDQTRYVGHREAMVSGLYDPKVRVQGGERVISNFWFRCAQGRNKARFSGRRIADERDICDRFEFESDNEFISCGAEQ